MEAVAVAGPQADIGRDVVEMQRTAAVDDDGDLGGKARGERRSRQSPAHIMRDLAGVETFFLAEPGQRIRHHGNALVRRNAEGSDVRRERAGACVAQAAKLDAAARGDFDDAVAVAPRGGAKAANAASEIVAPDGVSRARSPSPVAIGAERPGQAPRRIGDWRRLRRMDRRVHSAASTPAAKPAADIVAARMPQAEPPRLLEPLGHRLAPPRDFRSARNARTSGLTR